MSGLYVPYKTSLLNSSAPDLTSVDIKLVLVDGADYTLDLTNHDFLDDVAAGALVATSGNLAGKSVTAGEFDATNPTPAFTAATGDPSEMVICYYDSGSAATSRLLAVWDAGTGLPVTPNGGDINVSWASYIFKI